MLGFILLLVDIVIGTFWQKAPLSAKVMRSLNYICLLQQNDGSLSNDVCAATAPGGLF